MSLFNRKPRLAHQLIATTEHNNLSYRCSVCTRTFSSAGEASWKYNKEWCPGKHCYTSLQEMPAYIIRGDRLKEERRALRKGQEPLAYLCIEFMRGYGGFSGGAIQAQEYIPLYDIRECVALDGAVPLPAFDE